MTTNDIFISTYNELTKIAEKIYSNNFKIFVDKITLENNPTKLLRTPLLTGYFIRCVEEKIGKNEIKPNDTILEILNEKIPDVEKIEKISDYLDRHNLAGLNKELIKSLIYIPFEDIQKYFEIYIEDYIKYTIDKVPLDKKHMFSEVCYRNAAYGYLYRLVEGLITNFSN